MIRILILCIAFFLPFFEARSQRYMTVDINASAQVRFFGPTSTEHSNVSKMFFPGLGTTYFKSRKINEKFSFENRFQFAIQATPIRWKTGTDFIADGWPTRGFYTFWSPFIAYSPTMNIKFLEQKKRSIHFFAGTKICYNTPLDQNFQRIMETDSGSKTPFFLYGLTRNSRVPTLSADIALALLRTDSIKNVKGFQLLYSWSNAVVSQGDYELTGTTESAEGKFKKRSRYIMFSFLYRI